MRIDLNREVRRPAEADGRPFTVLDGWRGLSILLVPAAHLLSLGPPVPLAEAAEAPLILQKIDHPVSNEDCLPHQPVS